MTTEPVVLHEACDLLSVIPYQLGFVPRRSLVAVSLRGLHHRVGLTMRLDVAALREEPDAGGIDAIVRALRGDGARGAVLVLYAEPSAAGLLLPAHLARPMALLEARCQAAGIMTVSHLLTADDHWQIEPQSQGGAMRWAGPRGEVDAGLAGRVAARSAAAPAANRSEAISLATADPTARQQAMRAAATSWRAHSTGRTAWQVAALRQWRAALADGAPRPSALGRTEAGLRDTAVRDAALLTLIPAAAADLPERSLLGEGLAEASVAYESVFTGCGRVAQDVAQRASTLLGLLAAHAARRRRAPALAMWSWLEWWQGHGVRASLLIDKALADDRQHSFAGLMAQVLRGGIAPGWARPEPLE